MPMIHTYGEFKLLQVFQNRIGENEYQLRVTFYFRMRWMHYNYFKQHHQERCSFECGATEADCEFWISQGGLLSLCAVLHRCQSGWYPFWTFDGNLIINSVVNYNDVSQIESALIRREFAYRSALGAKLFRIYHLIYTWQIFINSYYYNRERSIGEYKWIYFQILERLVKFPAFYLLLRSIDIHYTRPDLVFEFFGSLAHSLSWNNERSVYEKTICDSVVYAERFWELFIHTAPW